MAATTRPSAEPQPAPTVVRFDRAERWLHWVNAALVGVCVLTAATLYVAPLSALVGRRELFKTVHVAAGLALPLPFLAVLAGRWGAGFRRDLRRLDRFTADDRRWLRTLGRDPFVRLGKFNPGQKLNAAFTAGALALLLGTGAIMRWFDPFPLSWRTGATFVHDWTTVALVLAVAGHVGFALRDRDALGAMQHGTVRTAWARRRAPRWLVELEGAPERGAD